MPMISDTAGISSSNGGEDVKKTLAVARAGWLVFVAAVTSGVAVASDRPAQPVCLSSGVTPVFAPLNAAPIAQATRVLDGRRASPSGANCFEKADSAATWITVASTVQTSDGQNAFIERFGSVSTLLTVRYWSTSEQKWRPLVSSASAIVSTNATTPRADYSLAELVTGEDRYYSVTDSRSGRAVTYRLRLWTSQPTGFVVESANVDAIRQWGITLYDPGGLHTLYFLKKQSPNVWTYYSITRLLPKSFLADGHDKSFINRAVALYRHVVGLPTDAEPPSAP
jgi:hypothetical protein